MRTPLRIRESDNRAGSWRAAWTAALVLAAGACLAVAMGCSSGKGGSSDEGEDKKGRTVGIDPIIYECHHLVKPEEVGEALGGEAELMQVAFEPPPGVAEPCNYLLTLEDGTKQPWSFDMDCRSNALKTADQLFEQYEKKPMNDAGVITNETGMVPIGRKAMDHHGQALLAVDDDTDCYVRIMGPVAEGRSALGRLVLDKLEWKNAPMRPRAR